MFTIIIITCNRCTYCTRVIPIPGREIERPRAWIITGIFTDTCTITGIRTGRTTPKTRLLWASMPFRFQPLRRTNVNATWCSNPEETTEERRARVMQALRWHRERINLLLFRHVHHRDQRDVTRELLPVNVTAAKVAAARSTLSSVASAVG